MTRPDLDAIRAKWKQRNVVSGNDVPTLLRYIDELEERCRAYEQMRHEIARSLDTWKQEEVPDET